jgi:hypothetical protein
VDTTPASSGLYQDADAQCQAGESVVGGGVRVDPAVSSGGATNVVNVENRPATASGGVPAEGAEPRGWYAEWRQATDAAQTVTVYVLCAS